MAIVEVETADYKTKCGSEVLNGLLCKVCGVIITLLTN